MATLSWTSRNVSSVVSSNFGATAVSGSVVVGPLDATTDYTITCSGAGGSATAHATVVVGSGGVSSIPTGVVLYSLQSPSGSTTLYYRSLSGGDAVSVGTYASGVTVLGVDPAGSRLVLSAPVNGDATKLGVFLTDLDGVSHSVRMGTDMAPSVGDAWVTPASTVLVAWIGKGAAAYTLAGVRVGSAAYSFYGDSSVSIAANAAGTMAYYTDQAGGTIRSATLPTFTNAQNLATGGGFDWLRADPTGALLTFGKGGGIWTMNAATGASKTQVASNGSYPTFDSTGTRVIFSRVGDGIYIKDLSSGTESKLASVSGTWNGRIFWH